MNRKMVYFTLAMVLTILSPGQSQELSGTAGQGSLLVLDDPGQDEGCSEFVLRHTEVHISIAGFAARVTVEQQFGNDLDHAVEGIYVFPLPENAAVDQMEMTIGKRKIVGTVQKRADAERIYETAKNQGKTAALLTQERPNIFTQAVANIMPGDAIAVKISYFQNIKYDHGQYELNFPMVVGPRYIPGNPIGKQGGGWAPDTDLVTDASRITPPVLKPNQRSGHDIAITVDLDAGISIRHLECVSHQIYIDYQTESYAKITLAPKDTIPNKDFILRYQLDGDLPEAAFFSYRDDRDGFFSLVLQPQVEFGVNEITPKELIFVVDCSGSMHGEPMAQAKKAMLKFIDGMNPADSFQIIKFSSSASSFSPYPLPNTPANVQKGVAYVRSMAGSGGTQMIEGIKAALDYPADPKRMRMVVFMTDGYIGNEVQILAAIQNKVKDARLFSFGVGTSVNHYLLSRMADAGRGFYQYVRPDENSDDAVDLFFQRISNPLLTDIQIDWADLGIYDVYPAVIPDLFSAQPVIIHGRFQGTASGKITIRGKINQELWVKKVRVDTQYPSPENDYLASLWARSRIKILMDRMVSGERQDLVNEVTALALKYHLMSQYTAFVAVTEETRNTIGGRQETIQIPVLIPEKVSYSGVFGDSAQNQPECKKSYRQEKGMGFGSSSSSVAAQCEEIAPDQSIHVHKTLATLGQTQDEDTPFPACQVSVVMISGDFSENEIINELNRLLSSDAFLSLSCSFKEVTLTLRKNPGDSMMKLEIVQFFPRDDQKEKVLYDFLKDHLKLNGKTGSVTVKITI